MSASSMCWTTSNTYLCAPLMHLPLSEIGTTKMNFSLDFHPQCGKPKLMGSSQSPIPHKKTKFLKKFFHIQSKKSSTHSQGHS
jgi:hypothetical protein